MSWRTKFFGDRRAGDGSDTYLSPRNPQTGDGRTRRHPHDRVTVEFQPGYTPPPAEKQRKK